jgi:hypothetical protein
MLALFVTLVLVVDALVLAGLCYVSFQKEDVQKARVFGIAALGSIIMAGVVYAMLAGR